MKNNEKFGIIAAIVSIITSAVGTLIGIMSFLRTRKSNREIGDAAGKSYAREQEVIKQENKAHKVVKTVKAKEI